MATVTDFTVIQGKALEFAIIVKENGTTLPLVLDVSDTFTFSVVDKKTNQKYITNKAMVLDDINNGKIVGTISAVESATFPIKKAASEDGYIPRANLRLVVHGNTLSQGEMTASIEDVYVITA